MLYTEEHDEIKQMVRDFVDNEINPHADEWEEAKMFPAHEVLKNSENWGCWVLTEVKQMVVWVWITPII